MQNGNFRFQGRAVKENHSVFTDEYFLPYDDQWKYLSSVQKLSEKEIIEISDQIQKKLGFSIPLCNEENPFENKKPPAVSLKSKDTENEELNSSDFSQKVKITLTNRIEIQKAGISERALYMNCPHFFGQFHATIFFVRTSTGVR